MKKITEKSGEHKRWYEQAEGMTMGDLPAFLKSLTEDYEHDYGTIVHAIAAGMCATMRAMNNTPQGGITGFQASCMKWAVLENAFHVQAPVRLLDYKKLLFPQYESDFNSIGSDVWKSIQEMAQENLRKAKPAHPDVIKHWESIASGIVPFGMGVTE